MKRPAVFSRQAFSFKQIFTDITMIIKVCGMRDPENIRAVSALDIDLLGFVFYPKSPRFVRMIPSGAGIVPDYSQERLESVSGSSEAVKRNQGKRLQRVGLFIDDMPQNIITRVYNYQLDYVQLHGNEPRTTCDNLRSTIDPDIRPGIKIIKTIRVRTESDLNQCREYEGAVDLFIFDTRNNTADDTGKHFDPTLLAHYDGEIPFLLSGGIGPDDTDKVLDFDHPKCVGINLNLYFEIAPAVKDVDKLNTFISKIRQNKR